MCRHPLRLPRRPRAGPRDGGRSAEEHGTWITAIDDHLPADLLRHASTCGSSSARAARQALDLGRRLPDRRHRGLPAGSAAPSGEAIAETDRKVVLIASGALSATPSGRCASCATTRPRDSTHICTPEARAADAERIAWFKAGDHARVLETMPEFLPFRPEARFAPLPDDDRGAGRRRCTAPARQYGEYENSVGTGQVHLWFDRPADGSRARPRRPDRGTAPPARRRGDGS